MRETNEAGAFEEFKEVDDSRLPDREYLCLVCRDLVTVTRSSAKETTKFNTFSMFAVLVLELKE